MRAYGDCTNALYEYARVNYNRSAKRMSGQAEPEHEELRQEAYQSEVKARAAIGQVTFLSGSSHLDRALDQVRESIRGLSDAHSPENLASRHRKIQEKLKEVLYEARTELRGKTEKLALPSE